MRFLILERIDSTKLFDDFPLEIDQGYFQQGLRLLRHWTEVNQSSGLDEVLTRLKKDYSGLFLGPEHLGPHHGTMSCFKIESLLAIENKQ